MIPGPDPVIVARQSRGAPRPHARQLTSSQAAGSLTEGRFGVQGMAGWHAAAPPRHRQAGQAHPRLASAPPLLVYRRAGPVSDANLCEGVFRDHRHPQI